ncbi:unnamed protein product [Brassica rapa]|uniref:Uncharacterized protein n=1 Tax=Brassica campestris TaxID=3711 RepID=A0A8D9HCT5_BRACM|nr:unnamed protein product [Brassica rapa]
MNFVFQICSSRRVLGKSSSCRRLTWKSSDQCRDDLHGSHPSYDLHESRP